MNRLLGTRRVVAVLGVLVFAACSAAVPAGVSGTDGSSPGIVRNAPVSSEARPMPPHSWRGSSLDRRASAVQEVAYADVDASVVPGLVVVLADGSGTRTVALGESDRDRGTPMRAGDLFRVASITKAMVASVVLQLVDEGVIRLDDTVERWQPGLLAHGDEITIAQLLGHVSGLPDPDLGRFVGRPGVAEEDIVRQVARRRLDAPPGNRLAYRDVNYIVLGLVVEHVTGEPLDRVLQRRLFSSLGMPSATFVKEGVVPGGMVHGYVGHEDVTDLDIYWGEAAAGVAADGRDVSRFIRGLFAGGVLTETQLAAMVEVREHKIMHWTGYGLGMARTQTDCGEALGHSGRIPGYSSEAWAASDTSRSVVVLANTTSRSADRTLDTVVEAALCG